MNKVINHDYLNVEFIIDDKSYLYTKNSTYYCCVGTMHNDIIFKKLKLDKDSFCEKAYGYSSEHSGEGFWPEWRENDGYAHLKIIDALINFIDGSKAQEPSNEEMILAEARRKYPIGTIYTPLYSSGESYTTQATSTRECYFWGGNDIECGEGFVYANGKWAEIFGEDMPKVNMSITECNGFYIDEIVECARTGMGMDYNSMGNLFTIFEFGTYKGGLGVKLKDSTGNVYVNSGYGDFVGIDSIKKRDYSSTIVTNDVSKIKALLSKANRDYPIGTYYNALDAEGRTVSNTLFKAQRSCNWIEAVGAIDCGYGFVYANGKWAEIEDIKENDIDDILAEAKRRYPIGTRYNAINHDGVDSGLFELSERECKWVYIYGVKHAIDCGYGYVYFRGRWADIVTDESKEGILPSVNYGGIIHTGGVSGMVGYSIEIPNHPDSLPKQQTPIILTKKVKKAKIITI